ncbi:hypothetical protein ACEPPN_009521 [Leptodophora sp. 'Broadleaf-Isolate-01']
MIVVSHSWMSKSPHKSASPASLVCLYFYYRLRRKWRELAKFPRVLPLAEADNTIPPGVTLPIILQKSKPPQPAVLRACKESCSECLKFYSLIFGTHVEAQCEIDCNTPNWDFRAYGYKRALFYHEPTVYINCDLDTVYLSSKFCSTYPFGTKLRFESGSNIRLRPSLKSIAFSAAELYYIEDLDDIDGDQPSGIQAMKGLFEVYKNVEEIIMVDTIAGARIPSEGEFEFIEIEDTDDVSNVIDRDQFKKLFKWMSKRHDRRIAVEERLSTHEWAYTGMLRVHGYWKERENPASPGPPKAPFARPVIKVKGMTRGGIRI